MIDQTELNRNALEPSLALLPDQWRERIECLHYAYQPIVCPKSVSVYGVEALLRGTETLGMPTIQSLFDLAFEDGVLHAFDLCMRYKALMGCAEQLRRTGSRLFYNLDTRCIIDPNYSSGSTAELLSLLDLQAGQVCLEISEQNELLPQARVEGLLSAYRDQGYTIALDDYGSGYGQLRTLFVASPEVLKIDRFFVQNIDVDPKKLLFLTRILGFAQELGLLVVVEGVETEHEFEICLEIGVDLVQGYFLMRPTTDVDRALTLNFELSSWS